MNSYINSIEKPEDFKETGICLTDYIDIIEKCFEAYDLNRIENMLMQAQKTKKACEEKTEISTCSTDVQSFSRITLALGILIKHGRKQHLKRLMLDMMDVLCSILPYIKEDGRLDFAIKDTMLLYMLIKDYVDKENSSRWFKLLETIDPYSQYKSYYRPGVNKSRPGNISVYLIAAEAMRQKAGMTDSTGYIDDQISYHLKYFDENGMYIDPGAPMLYDSATRAQLQVALHYDYKGKYAKELDNYLKKAALSSLFMQSSAYEFPFGGRSNQYLFNETYFTANCEYEARRYKEMNELKIAGMFKRAAHLSVLSIKRWLELNPAKHIKNMYSWDSGYGTDPYGYYDKYMVSMACFLYIGIIDCDDTIKEYPCPAETGNYIFKTSNSFHKIFANYYGHSVEVDMKANLKHDATGMGRYHRTGVPTELGLSVPITQKPAYYITDRKNVVFEDHNTSGKSENENIHPLSISSIVNLGDKLIRLAECSENLVYDISTSSESFSIKYTNPDFGFEYIVETYTFNQSGITINAIAEGDNVKNICFTVPVLYTNGKDITNVDTANNRITVNMNGHKYTILSDNGYKISGTLFNNRNGVYREVLFASETKQINLTLSLS